jgi:hypothetical protein
MMVPSEQCRRCREWVSVALDVPLSQFEQALLRRHLSACGDCATFAADVRGATALLRAAEPVEPSAPVEVRLPRRASSQLLARSGLAVAAAAAAVAALSTSGLTNGTQLGGAAAQAASSAELPSMRLVRSQQLRPSATVRIRVIEVD